MTAPATITTIGSGSASGTPDAMRLRVGVRTTDSSAPKALAGVAAGATRLGEVASAFVAEERIASRGLSVWPHHTTSEGDGYQASHAFELYCDSLEKAGELVTALGEALRHELTIDSVDPVLSDASGLIRQARAHAFEDARAKATEMAALAGRALGEVITIVEEGGFDRPFIEFSSMSGADGAMPFEPGASSVTAGVRVTWQLTTA